MSAERKTRFAADHETRFAAERKTRFAADHETRFAAERKNRECRANTPESPVHS